MQTKYMEVVSIVKSCHQIYGPENYKIKYNLLWKA